MTTTVSPTGYLNLEQAAAELGLRETVHVQRLIARARIKSARVGSQVRVAASELARYIGTDAPDLEPRVTPGGWFDDAETKLAADSFLDTFTEAARDQVPEKAAEGVRTMTLTVTPAMRAIADGPARSYTVARPKHYIELPDAASAYLLQRLRFFAGQIAERRLSKLYESRDAYEEITGEAMTRLGKSVLSWTEHLPSDEIGKPWAAVSMEIPVAEILTASRRVQILTLAF